MQPIASKLNKQQRDAVQYGDGPILIIAGAGTGKTTVVTERVKYLIASSKAKPSEILALTFTEKAAQEMQERVDIALPLGYSQLWVSTFHAFCDQVLRESAFHIGLDPNYKLMTQAEALFFLRTNLFEFNLKYFRPLGNPTKFLYGLLQHFSRLQDESIAPADYVKWAKSTKDSKLELEKWLELANAFQKYDELKIKESYFDFGDLITKTLMLFKKRPNVLKVYQDKFKYILIDEFQDTNFAQNELAALLSGKKGDITVVADDDQSIYRFRGAAISNMLQFRKKYPNSKLIPLTQNYRSYQEILDAAHSLIQFNNPDRLEVTENIDKSLKASRGVGGEIIFFHENTSENEADRVAAEIQALIADGNYSYKDIAILVRANTHADAFIRTFERLSLPYQFLGPEKLFEREEIVDLISYLKVIYNFEDSVSLSRVLAIENLAIPIKDIVKLGNNMRKAQESLYETINQVEEILDGETSILVIQSLKKLIDKHIGDSRTVSAGSILYEFMTEMKLVEKLLNPDDIESQLRAENISKFFDRLKAMEARLGDGKTPAVVDWIDLITQMGDSPLASEIDWSEQESIKIVTVHSAKGLEFPVVFMVDLVGERFPSRRRSEQIPIPEAMVKEQLPTGDYHTQEERRLFYVGMTRAKDRLYFTAADFYGDAKRRKKLSPFIFEALGEGAISSESKSQITKQLSLLDYKGFVTNARIKEKTPVHVDYLSYSQIQAFQMCPLHYKLKYILKVPTAPSHAQSFGISIHDTLRDVYRAAKAKEKVNTKSAIKLLQQNWLREGYVNKKHGKEAFSRAKGYLTKYIKEIFDPEMALHSVEEKPFVVPIVKDGVRLKIGGKIDRIDVKPDGSIEIVDYKTSENVPDQKTVDRDMQLSFYALAGTKIDEYPLGKNPEEITLSLLYFAENKAISTKRTRKDLVSLENEIFKIKSQIESSDFKCSGHPFCENCEYAIYCKSSNSAD